MKNRFFYPIIFLVFTPTLYAQTEALPWQFSLGINAVDTFPTATEG